MNRERHRYWSAYVADLQSRMLLGHWEVTLDREPADQPEAGAEVNRLPGRCKAHIKLHDRIDDYPRVEQRHIVVHELVHLHLAPLEYHLETQTALIDKAERASIIKGHRSHEEYAVDQLARIIAPTVSLPPKAAKP